MRKKYIFILGTGRCGTMSLVSLLNYQDQEINITHERNRMSWIPDLIALGITFERLQRRDETIVGDCGFWYLSYVLQITNYLSSEKVFFICLKRSRVETINSYMAKTPATNNWTDRSSSFYNAQYIPSEEWYRCYPHYDLPKKEAIAQFYDDYYKCAEDFVKRIRNFRIFDMESTLQTEEGQNILFDFLDIKNPIYKTDIKLNEGRHK